VQRFSIAAEVSPCIVIIQTGMEEFAAAQRGVSVLPEKVWQRQELGVQLGYTVCISKHICCMRRMARK